MTISHLQARSLDELARQFANPPKEYSPVPIWWWSGDRLERSRLRWQMEQLIAGGIYNVIILNLAPTSPLYGSDPDRPAFMSDEWWEIFLGVCEDAKTLGMRIWFYDQIGFSGANLQGEIVRSDPRCAGQSLESIIAEGEGTLELTCPSEGQPLSAAYTLIDADDQPLGSPVSVPLEGGRAKTDAPGRKRLRLMYAIRRGFDYFHPEACQRLLDTVHGTFEKKAGQFFGDVIVGSFQDELPSLLSWSADFTAQFRRIKGYDLLDNLIALWEGEGPESERVRVDYHQARAELAEAAFFRPFFDWHERHGLICGFDQQGPARAGEPIGGVRLYADYLRTHRWYAVPGNDHHGHTKIHSSLAHLYGRPRVWIEAFHSSGWGGTLEETFDWLLPWLRAGATLYNPHAVYYSTRGDWWEWAPPSTCWRQPYWRHYPVFANAVSRLCFLLSQGSHVCDIGVLYPTTTIQAGLTVEKPLPGAQAANATYEALVGSMMFLSVIPGVLDQDRRDFDILDDDSVQNGSIHDGALHIGAERFPIIVLPSCTALESATADQLIRFVEGGGALLAVGDLPQHVTGETPDRTKALGELRELFAAGKATLVARPEDLPTALSHIPRRVETPVPVLHRRIDGMDVLFVPAAFPHATRSKDPGASWLRANYSFDPERYQRGMTITVRGAEGTPQLWDPSNGERRPLPVTPRGDEVEITIPFDTAPAALIVWAGEDTQVVGQTSGSTLSENVIFEFSGLWECELEKTLDHLNGDFVQTWRFLYRIEAGDSTETIIPDGEWQAVHATFGMYGWWGRSNDVSGESGADGWQPAVYSLKRGIYKDPIHEPTLGPKGHVPEEFLAFGKVSAGETIRFRTTVWMSERTTIHLATGAAARKEITINGNRLVEDTPGYLWITPIQLNEGANSLDWRFTAETDIDLRAYWALTRDPDSFARPERMTTPGVPKKDSRLQFSLKFNVPFAPTQCTLQVAADAPCRVVVNGREAGRQGGFDPYHSLARVQPYPVDACRQGENEVIVEVQDTGHPISVLVDGLVHSPSNESLKIISDTHWQVRRDDGAPQTAHLTRQQWLDPAWSHLWRRPHPLPGARWIEEMPYDDSVLPVVPDALDGEIEVQWFRWMLPPGATKMFLPVAGELRVWIDGEEQPVQKREVTIPAARLARRVATMRLVPKRGRTGGGVFHNPVIYLTALGWIELGEWSEQGLGAFSGGVRYRAEFALAELPNAKTHLDLGRVRGTAEVWINGQNVGTRVWSPYRFDITHALTSGRNTVEILVLNTLAPYLESVSPTHYVRPGQVVSGLFGPVRIVAEISAEI